MKNYTKALNVKTLLSLSVLTISLVGFQNCARSNFASTIDDQIVTKLGAGVTTSPDQNTEVGTSGAASGTVTTIGESTGGGSTGGTNPSCVRINKKDIVYNGGAHEVSCGNSSSQKCALVCHVPPGNPAAKHNIIVGMSARLGPHQPGGHGGDYDGPCSDSEPNIEACEE